MISCSPSQDKNILNEKENFIQKARDNYIQNKSGIDISQIIEIFREIIELRKKMKTPLSKADILKMLGKPDAKSNHGYEYRFNDLSDYVLLRFDEEDKLIDVVYGIEILSQDARKYSQDMKK